MYSGTSSWWGILIRRRRNRRPTLICIWIRSSVRPRGQFSLQDPKRESVNCVKSYDMHTVLLPFWLSIDQNLKSVNENAANILYWTQSNMEFRRTHCMTWIPITIVRWHLNWRNQLYVYSINEARCCQGSLAPVVLMDHSIQVFIGNYEAKLLGIDRPWQEVTSIRLEYVLQLATQLTDCDFWVVCFGDWNTGGKACAGIFWVSTCTIWILVTGFDWMNRVKLGGVVAVIRCEVKLDTYRK